MTGRGRGRAGGRTRWLQPDIYAVGALALAAVLGLGAREPWDLERTLFWTRGTAWCALVSLGLTLSVTPLGRLLARLKRSSMRDAAVARLGRTRRALGITSAALGTAHATLGLVFYVRGSWHLLLDLTWLRSGLLTWAVLLALWLTSYPAFIKRARIKLWKPLHRLTYVAVALAIHHALFSPSAVRLYPLIFTGALLAVSSLRFLPKPART